MRTSASTGLAMCLLIVQTRWAAFSAHATRAIAGMDSNAKVSFAMTTLRSIPFLWVSSEDDAGFVVR